MTPTTGNKPSSEEWVLLSVGRGGELGSLKRIIEKMSRMGNKMNQFDIQATQRAAKG